jgi:benzoylformate decarboxylase
VTSIISAPAPGSAAVGAAGPLNTGHRRLLEQLRVDGVRHLFGNPGSSEEGLLDEIARFPDIGYVLGLQEAAVVCVADGYAQATGEPSVVLLHSGVGLGNAVGSLYHALHRQTPMLVLAGEAGVAYDALEAHMSVNLVDIARPVTKYATRATHPASLVRLVRRCLKIAATPPRGPVFLALPQDVLDQPGDEPIVPTLVPDTRVVPEAGAIETAARLLAGARSPVILAGDGVAASGAVEELTRCSETWGARVWGAMVSELVMPWTHPLYAGLTGHMFGTDSAAIVAEADAVLVCGTYLFPDVFPATASPFRPGATVVHIDLDANAIAKNHPVTIGMVSDPRLTLRALSDTLDRVMTDPQRAAAAQRTQRWSTDSARSRAQAREADRARAGEVPLRMSAVAACLADLLPADAVVFDEALTNSPELTRWLTPSRPGHFFQTPGGTLGVGIPGAVGAKLAHPERTVVGFTGDGGGMYTYQALWTAAHHRIGAKFVVCHNSSYQLLKENLVRYRQDSLAGGPAIDDAFPPCFDVQEPRIDFVALAGALGVAAAGVREPGELPSAVRAMLDHDGPYLLEVTLDREV